VGLLDQIVPSGCRNHLVVINIDEAWDLPNRGSTAPELIGTDRVWDIVLTQKSHQEVLGGLGIAVPLEQDPLHEAGLVHCSPQPVP